MSAFCRSHGSHAQGAVILVKLAGILFPHKNGTFADVQQLGDIFRLDDMAPLEQRALEPVEHGGDVVAERHADRLFYIYLFHVRRNPFSGVF